MALLLLENGSTFYQLGEWDVDFDQILTLMVSLVEETLEN
jgi:hypothetical protein